MKNLITIFFLSILSLSGYSQALFSKRMKSVADSGFCVDCGDVKAEKDNVQFTKLLNFIASHNYINKTKGIVKFQVLIDSTGSGKVLSHTDTTNSVLVQNIVHSLNAFKGWKPAITNSKAEPLVSVVVAMEISNDKIIGEIERHESINLVADNFGSFNNIAVPTLTKRRTVFSNWISSFKNFGADDLFDSAFLIVGFTASEKFGTPPFKNSFVPIKGEAYDPFNFNRTLSPINLQPNNANQFLLKPLNVKSPSDIFP